MCNLFRYPFRSGFLPFCERKDMPVAGISELIYMNGSSQGRLWQLFILTNRRYKWFEKWIFEMHYNITVNAGNMSKRNLLIASTSTVFEKPYLAYLTEELEQFYNDVDNIIFFPFARPGGISYDDYTALVSSFFSSLDKKVTGIHESDNMPETVNECDGIFAGGGNTFVLLNALYRYNLMDPLRKRVLAGIPYLGTSAGSNILGVSIQTTNDMPVVYPPSFAALAVVPFNMNPHYTDPDPDSKHMGETRETRIKEFLVFNDVPVAGLREGSYFIVSGNNMRLGGNHSVRIFERSKEPYEINPGSDVSFLLNEKE